MASSPTGTRPALLLARLDAIGAALRDSGRALALIGLGSVGLEGPHTRALPS